MDTVNISQRRQAWFQAWETPAQSERLVLKYQAQGEIKGRVLYIHPFAEELNKTRRMVHLQAERLAREGFEVYQLDLFGCGDSSGEFGDASWDLWVSDIHAAFEYLKQSSSSASPLWLWGSRLGCVLACAAAARMADRLNFLFWQPLLSGQAQLQQLLRLISAGELLSAQPSGEAAVLRDRLNQRLPVVIGGYTLSSPLLQGMATARLSPPAGKVDRVIWLDLTSSSGTATVSPATTQIGSAWTAAGASVHYQQVQGPAFWQTVEMEDAPQLLDATMAALLQDGAS